MRGRILGQDKDVNGKLTRPMVKNAVGKLKEQYADRHENPNQPIIGFELNGGDGMTKGAQNLWDEFKSWCDEKGLEAIYNTNQELEIMRNNLRIRVYNKCKNKNI